MLQVRGTGLRLIEGVVADHLKDGRSVRVDFEMTILDKAQGTPITQNRQSFTLSFDLWEQRYAVTRAGAAPRSISHLAARDAEAWCLENMALPLTALGRFARDLPFWIRVEYRVQDRPPPADRHRVAVHAAHADRGAQPPAAGRGAGAIDRRRPVPDRQLVPRQPIVQSLRNRLIAAFLVATLLPLGATIWITTSLLERSLGYATTAELDGLSRTLEATMRQFYERERRSLKQDAAAARVTATSFDMRAAGSRARGGAGVLGQRRGRALHACRAPAATASTT